MAVPRPPLNGSEAENDWSDIEQANFDNEASAAKLEKKSSAENNRRSVIGYVFHAPSPVAPIGWDGPDDKGNPQNWPFYSKMIITIVSSMATLTVSFGSSVMSSAIPVIAAEYGVSATVSTLAMSLYVLGFAAGPLAWGPLSELIGRRWPFLIGYGAFLCFTVGVAVSQTLYSIMICRFLQGAFGVATVTVTPGIIVDIWSARTRPLATIAWGMTIIVGPTFGPVIGSFTTINPSLGWRWTMWITLIVSGVLFLLSVPFVPETWAPLRLQKRAGQIRFETKDWAVHAPRDEAPVEPKTLMKKYGLKPILMLLNEPILDAITAYNSLIYGVIYLTFEAYPYAFGTVRQWEQGVSSLPFLSLFVGYIFATIIAIWMHKAIVEKKIDAGIRPPPEDQLPVMIVGSVFLIVGLFWFAWTSFPSISPWPQIVSGTFLGIGISLVFLPCITYIMETYLYECNSALAANTIMRSAAAAGFPLFASPMYFNLGVQWATSLLGFLCIAFLPAPLLFYFYGAKIRAWSKYVPNM